MTNLSQNILKKIKKECIKPRPKWQFIAIHILLWSTFLSSIILGSMAISVILRILGGTDWEIARRAGKGSLHSFALILPYIWLIFLAITVFIAHKLFTKTKKGYKFRPIFIAMASVLISLIIGGIFYYIGLGHVVQKNLIKVKPYASWQQQRNVIMMNPERGILVGKIITIDGYKELLIMDFKNTKWAVDISKARPKNNFKIRIDTVIGMTGKKTGMDTFKANKIMPWRREFIPKPKNNNLLPVVKPGIPIHTY